MPATARRKSGPQGRLNELLTPKADQGPMVIAAALESRGTGDNRRATARRTLRLEVPGRAAGESTRTLIHDLSVTGILIETAADLAVGDEIELEIPEAGASRATVVWSSGEFFGCQFAARISTAAVSAALLRTPFAPADAPEAEQPVAAAEEGAASPGTADGLSLPAKVGIIVGASLLLWAVIAAAILAI